MTVPFTLPGVAGSFIEKEPIHRGWSGDAKFRVMAGDGTPYLLRLSPAERLDVRRALHTQMQQAAALGIPMCRPVAFGQLPGGDVFSLQRWVNGEDLEAVLPGLPPARQYALGLESGEALRLVHSIPAPDNQEPWGPRFSRKVDRNINIYRTCGLRFAGDGHVLAYLAANRHLLAGRPQCFQHGDFHAGNMMLEKGRVVLIDFDRFDFGDPWEDFSRIVWSAAASPHFATGQVVGYFGGPPPLDFWQLLAFYIGSNTLSSLPWAVPFGAEEIDVMLRQAADVLRWFDNFKSPVPSWYLADYPR